MFPMNMGSIFDWKVGMVDCLVQVEGFKFLSGQEVDDVNFIDEELIFPSRYLTNNYIVKDCWGFRCTLVRELGDSKQMCGLEGLLIHNSWSEIVEHDINKIELLLEATRQKQPVIITAWRYHIEYDVWGEIDSYVELLGRVDMKSKLQKKVLASIGRCTHEEPEIHRLNFKKSPNKYLSIY